MKDRWQWQLPLWRRRVLVFMTAAIPLLFVRSLNDPINVPKLSLLLIGIAIVAAIRAVELMKGASLDGLRRLLLPAALISAPLTIAWALSPYRGWSAFGHYPRFTGLVPYLAVILFGVLLADAFAGRGRELQWSLLIAGGGAGVYALIQAVGLDPFSWTIRGLEAERLVVATLGNSNFAGGFFAIVLPVGVSLIRDEPRRRMIAAVLSVLVAAGLIAAGSQAAIGAAIAGLAIVAGRTLRGRWSWSSVLGYAVAALAAAAIVGSVIAGIVADDLPYIGSTVERRAQWWIASTDMVSSAPLVGRGPSAFALEHSRYRTFEDVVQVTFDITDDPHSLFFSFATGAGLIGVGGLIAAIVVIGSRGVRRDDATTAGFLGAGSAYLTQALVSVDTVALRSTFWVIVAGLAVSSLPIDDPEPSRSKKAKKKQQTQAFTGPQAAVALGLSIAAFLSVFWGFALLRSDRSIRRARVAFAEGEVNVAQDLFKSGIDARADIAYRRLYGDAMADVVLGLQEADAENLASELVAEVRQAYGFVHDLPHSNSTLDFARFLYAAKELDDRAESDAVDLYARAAELDPKNGVLLAEASAVAVEAEEFQVAVDMLERFPKLDTDASLLGNLALAYARLNMDQEAEEAVALALSIDPAQQNALEAQRILND
jgi:hypothetical protein